MRACVHRGRSPLRLEARELIMFKRWYRRAITRHRMFKAVLNPRGEVVIIGDGGFVRATTEALELLRKL
jgi:hypothetical protein